MLFALPSASFAAALTQQQSSSLIAVVQSSPGTPAGAFVSLITAFSNITITQATSLITVVQAAPSVPANAFVDLLTSFTVDTPATQPITPATTSSDVCTNIEGIQTAVPGGMTATGNVCITTQVNIPTPISTQQTTVQSTPMSTEVFVTKVTDYQEGNPDPMIIRVVVKDASGNYVSGNDANPKYITVSIDGNKIVTGTNSIGNHKVYTFALNSADGREGRKIQIYPLTATSPIVVTYDGIDYPFELNNLTK